MFEQSILASGNKSKRFWNVCLGVTGEALMVAFAVVAPMVWPQVLPRPQNWIGLYTPTAPAAPPRADPARPKAARVVPAHSVESTHSLTIPTKMPPNPVILEDPPVAVAGIRVPGGLESGSGPGVPGGFLRSILDSSRPVPQPRPPEARPASLPASEPVREIPRVRQGGLVDPATLIYRVEPRYPAIARQARIAGVVELECVIGIDGRMKEVAVRSGNPLLAPAAVEAVRQWVYRPTRLNGEPVEVIAPVTVTFRLGQ